MKRMSNLLFLSASALAISFAAGTASAGNADIDVADQAPYGKFLVNGQGMSLYLFEPDEHGESTCYGACAKAWPPVTKDASLQAGAGVDSDLLGTVERSDGAAQITYNGWPLYTFVRDKTPGDTNGQDVHGFGGEWYLVSPEGKTVEDH